MENKRKIKGHYVILSTDKTKIIIPQSDIGQAKYLSKNTSWSTHPTHHGIYLNNEIDDAWFISLDDDLKLQKKSIDDRFIVIPIKEENYKQRILWTWKTAQILINQEFDLYSLPNFVQGESSPISSYVLFNNEIVYFCDTNKLINYVFDEIDL